MALKVGATDKVFLHHFKCKKFHSLPTNLVEGRF